MHTFTMFSPNLYVDLYLYDIYICIYIYIYIYIYISLQFLAQIHLKRSICVRHFNIFISAIDTFLCNVSGRIGSLVLRIYLEVHWI